MWRFALLFSASCSLVPVSVSAAPPGAGSAPTTKATPASTEGSGPVTSGDVVYMPISTQPADPWVGVRGDKPVTFTNGDDYRDNRWRFREQKAVCSAMRDHCLPAISWMWTAKEHASRAVKPAMVIAFATWGPSQPLVAHIANIGSHESPFIAYRTVPATRANVVAGAIAVAHADAFPESPVDTYHQWTMGVIEKIDWDLGFVWFAGSEDARFITATRIAVLSYEPGGKVTIVGGKKRDELAVKPADVILPDP